MYITDETDWDRTLDDWLLYNLEKNFSGELFNATDTIKLLLSKVIPGMQSSHQQKCSIKRYFLNSFSALFISTIQFWGLEQAAVTLEYSCGLQSCRVAKWAIMNI